MKRMRKSKFFAYLLTLVLCLSLIPMQSLAAPSETDKYDAGYNIESILSQFQIFVEKDASLNAHTVGAIAVGGTYSNGNTFGDAAIVPSYIGTYGGGAFGNGWHGAIKSKDVYFGQPGEGVNMQYMEGNWVENPGYMNMKTAFEEIRSQSNALAQMGTKITSEDIVNGSITLNCENEYDYFVVPFDVFDSIQHMYIDTPSGDVDWFNENACVISIVGVNGAPLAIDNWDKIRINGIHMSQVFEAMSGKDPEFNKQLNFSGLNLVFNLPDASDQISMHGLGGHLVAPNADVYIGYSDYEGGVIAKGLTGTSQGHFYPMNKMLGTSSNKVRCSFQKRKLDYTGDALLNAKLKLSADVSLEKINKVSGPSINLGSDGKSITWTSDYNPIVLENLPAGVYKMEEIEVPEPYTYQDQKGNEVVESYIKADPIVFKVEDGKIYREIESGVYASNNLSDIVMVDGIKIENTGAECEFSKLANDGDGKDILGASMELTSDTYLTNVSKVAGPNFTVVQKKITWTTSKTPLKLANLPDGSYKLTENKAPDGYKVADPISFTIKAGKVIWGKEEVSKITMIDEKIQTTPEGNEVVLSKKEVALSPELAGAKIELRANFDLSKVTQVSGPTIATTKVGGIVKVISWTSGTMPVYLKGLPNGEYVMHEEAAPNGYLKTTDIEFKLTDGKLAIKEKGSYVDVTGTTVLMLDERGVDGTFSKKALSVAGDELPGAKIEITADVDISSVAQTKGPEITKNYAADGSVKKISWTSTTVPVELTGLPNGIYKMHEDAAPNGYTKATDIEFKISDGKILVKDTTGSYVEADKATVNMVDQIIEGTFSKVDAVTSKEIPTAELKLEAKNVDLSGVVAKNAVPANKFKATKTAITWTSTTTPLTISKLPAGSYTFTEVTAPEGYEVAEVVKFDIAENGQITQDGKVVKQVVMKDEPKTYEGTFSKVDAVTTKELPGAGLELKSSDADLTKVVAKNATKENDFKNTDGVITWTSTSSSLTLTKLPAGTYTFTETTVPNGYVKAETVTFTIKENGDIYVGSTKVDKVVMEDDPKVFDGEFSKQDKITTNELPGAELELKSSDANLTKVVAKNATDENKFKNTNGVITWTSTDTPLIISKLPAGTYSFTETTAPDGYEVAETVTFTIDNDGNFKQDGKIVKQIVMVDAPLAFTGTFSKTDMVTTKELPGAKLKLTSSNANLSGVKATNATDANKFSNVAGVITWTSTDKALTLTDLPVGSYEFTETTAPDGYEKAETVKFTINSKGEIYVGDTKVEKVVMEDAPKTYDGTFSKVDAVTSKELPGAELELKSSDADLKDVVAKNATKDNDFKNTDGVITWTSTKTALVLSKLPAGSYEFTETTAPDGYVKAETVEFTIDKKGNIFVGGKKVTKVTMKDSPETASKDGVFSKVDAATSEELPGAELILESTDADLSGITCKTDGVKITATTNSVSWTSGEYPVILSQLPAGTYTLTEKTAPEGYEKAETIKFNVDADGNIYKDTILNVVLNNKIVMEDKPVTFDGVFSKIDAATTKELPGAKLILESKDADLSDVAATNAKTENAYSNKNNVITWTSTSTPLELTSLPAGTYTLTEITAPKGYDEAETITFVISKSGVFTQDGVELKNNKITMIDEPKTYDGTFSKVDAVTSKEIAGAELTLTSSANISKVEAKSAEKDNKFANDGKTISWTSTTKPVVLTKLPAGDYTLTEVTAPEGYKVAETVKFTITKEGKITVDGEVVTKVVMKDAPKTYDGTFSKVDKVTTSELPGAELKLVSKDGTKLTDVKAKNDTKDNKFKNDNGVITWTSTSTPLTLTALPAGIYELTETTAPDGYDVAETVVFTLTKKGELIQNDKVVKQIVMVDAPKTYEGVFSKVDATEKSELPGAELKLTSKDADLKAVVAKNAVEANKFNNANGVITWVSTDEPLTLSKLPVGSYEFTETTAPDGYKKAETIKFSIDKFGNIIVGNEIVTAIVMEDQPDGSTTTEGEESTESTETTETVDTFDGVFSKVDATDGSELPGAELKLTSSDANLKAVEAKNAVEENNFKNNNGVITWVSTDEALTLTALPAGTYKFTETTAPKGFKKAETITFTIDEDGNMIVDGEVVEAIVMEDQPGEDTESDNDKTFDGTFSKVDATDGSELPGAELKLTSKDADLKAVEAKNAVADNNFKNEDGVITWTSTDKSLTLTSLPAGTYEFTETTAPKGFKKAETITFTIDEDGNMIVDGEVVDAVVMEDQPDETTTEKTTETTETTTEKTTETTATTTEKTTEGGSGSGNTGNGGTNGPTTPTTTTTTETTTTTTETATTEDKSATGGDKDHKDKTSSDSDKNKTTSDSDKSSNSTDTVVQTGDDFNGVIPVVIMIIAAAGIILCEERKRRI